MERVVALFFCVLGARAFAVGEEPVSVRMNLMSIGREPSP